jgi:hypothetical protein
MTDLLFQTPWWLPALIAVAGVVLFVTGNKRVENRVRTAGLAVIALAILLAAVSYLVDTPREKAEKQSRELCYAFERADWPKMTSILDRSTAVTVVGNSIYASRDEIVAAAKRAHERYGFKTVRVLSTSTEQTDTVITVNLMLLTEQSTVYAQTLNSEWQFDWEKRQDGWVLTEVRALKIGNITGDQMKPMFPSGGR